MFGGPRLEHADHPDHRAGALRRSQPRGVQDDVVLLRRGGLDAEVGPDELAALEVGLGNQTCRFRAAREDSPSESLPTEAGTVAYSCGLTATFLAWAAGFLGKVMVTTPLELVALILSASTPAGSGSSR